MHNIIPITSRSSVVFKEISSMISTNGSKRTHTLLIGEKLILSWLKANVNCRNRFIPTIWLRLKNTKPHKLESSLANKTIILTDSLMREITDMSSPQSHSLLVKIAPESTEPFASRIIVPWGIQNPGNLGAILRSAAAFGFHEALLGPLCADPLSPKALRGSMGAAFLLPVRYVTNISIQNDFWFALDSSHRGTTMDNVILREPIRILVGNEGHGWQNSNLPNDVKYISIKTCNVESLNAAVAAGIVCFEVARRVITIK